MANDSRRRVLIVDDDALIRDTLAIVLREEGYHVRVAHDGQVALETLNHWQPDVIVLDLMMPVMDGPAFRAVQRAATGTSHIPVIILSAAHNLPLRTAGLGAAAVFAKPFDLGTLLETIEHVLAT